LVELEKRGSSAAAKGAFSRKAPHAPGWRLTGWSCARAIRHELGSRKTKRRIKYPVAVSNQIHRAAWNDAKSASGINPRHREASKRDGRGINL